MGGRDGVTLVLKIIPVLIAAAGLTACMLEPEPYPTSRTPTSTPTSARLPDMTNRLPPIAPNLVTPPDPLKSSPVPDAKLPTAPPEIIAPPDTGPLDPR